MSIFRTKLRVKAPSLLTRAILSLFIVTSVIVPTLSPAVAFATSHPTIPSFGTFGAITGPVVGAGAALGALASGKTDQQTATHPLSSCIPSFSATSIISWEVSTCIAGVVYFFFIDLTSLFLPVAGIFFDFAAHTALKSDTYVSNVINESWVIARDLANMAFVFLLIYLAFALILNIESVGFGKTLARIIAVALLINFSFFFTRVVIDASNILAHQFYDNIAAPTTPTAGSATAAERGLSRESSAVAEISVNITRGVNVQQVIGNEQFKQYTKNNTGFLGRIGLLSLIFIVFGIINIILIFVFFTAAFQLIARIVGLWVAIIFSPIGFVSFAIPALSGLSHKWWNLLLKNAIFAPVFFLLLYITIFIVSGTCSGSICTGGIIGADIAASLNAPITGPGAVTDAAYSVAQALVVILLRLAIVVGLLLAALKAGEYIGSTGAAKMASWGRKLGNIPLKGAKFAGGFAFRTSVGRGASWADKKLAGSSTFNRLGAAGVLARQYSTQAVTGTSLGGAASFKEAKEASEKRERVSAAERQDIADRETVANAKTATTEAQQNTVRPVIQKLGARQLGNIKPDNLAEIAHLLSESQVEILKKSDKLTEQQISKVIGNWEARKPAGGGVGGGSSAAAINETDKLVRELRNLERALGIHTSATRGGAGGVLGGSTVTKEDVEVSLEAGRQRSDAAGAEVAATTANLNVAAQSRDEADIAAARGEHAIALTNKRNADAHVEKMKKLAETMKKITPEAGGAGAGQFEARP